MFRRFEFCFFGSDQEGGSLSRMTRCLFYVSNDEQKIVFVLVFLNLISNFQKSRICLCCGVPYIVSIFFTF